MAFGLIKVFAVGATAATIAVSHYLSDAQRVRRQIRRAKVVPIAEWPEGHLARLVGKVVAGETLIAPLSGRVCVYYRVEVHQDDRLPWQPIEESWVKPFVVDDGSGRAYLEANGADIVAKFDHLSRSGWFRDATEQENALVERHGQSTTGPRGFMRPLVYREAVIEPGERVSVVGVGRRELDPDAAKRVADYRQGAPTRMRLATCPDGKLCVSDFKRDLRDPKR